MPLERTKPEDKSSTWRPRKSILLYFDEIDEVLAVLKQTSGTVNVDTGVFRGDIASANDLRPVGTKRLSQCVLTAERDDNRITVDLGEPAGVIISSDSLELSGASAGIQSVLKPRQRNLGGIDWSANPMGLWTGVAVLGLIIGGILFGIGFTYSGPATTTTTAAVAVGTPPKTTTGKETSNKAFRPYGIGMLAVAFLALLGGAIFGRNPKARGTIILAYREEAPTWWKANHTAVTINLGTSVVVGVVFFFIGKAWH